MSGIEISVVPGYSISASIVFRSVCSSRGPQLSPKIRLKIPTRPDAINDRWSSDTSSSILNAIGHSRSLGSKIIVWLVLFFGISQIIPSARSQCGSITATPRPLRISSTIIFSKRTDFPIPVFPMIYICLRLSSGPIPKLISVPRKLVFPIGVKILWGLLVSERSGSITGRLLGGSKARLETQLINGVFT